jgi:hypothetical protein
MTKEGGNFIKTPIYVISCIVSVLRQYFGTPNRLSLEHSKYLWEEDQRKSDIYIAEDFHGDREVVGKKPCMLVGFPQMQFPKDVIADVMHRNDNSGSISYLGRTNGNVRIRCISDKSLSSIELATEVKYFIDVFRHQIQCAHGLDYLRASGVAGPTRIEEYKEHWTTEVGCEIMYQENWSVFVESLRFKSINLGLTSK